MEPQEGSCTVDSDFLVRYPVYSHRDRDGVGYPNDT